MFWRSIVFRSLIDQLWTIAIIFKINHRVSFCCLRFGLIVSPRPPGSLILGTRVAAAFLAPLTHFHGVRNSKLFKQWKTRTAGTGFRRQDKSAAYRRLVARPLPSRTRDRRMLTVGLAQRRHKAHEAHIGTPKCVVGRCGLRSHPPASDSFAVMRVASWLPLLALTCCCCFIGTDAFATSEAFTVIMDLFYDTKFHDTQMATALCITQHRYLKRNLNYTFPHPEPAVYDSCPYSTWFANAADVLEAQKTQFEFMYYIDRPDLVAALQSNPVTHFDAEAFIAGANHNLMQSRQTVFSAVNTLVGNEQSLGKVRQLVGESLHTLQDFYAHTNWVELGHRVINDRVGEDSYLGVDVNAGAVPACRDCSQDEMDDGERAEFNRIRSSAWNQLLLKLLGFRYENVFVCRGNVITDKLTSGYYGTEAVVAPKPQGKCSHGGGTDSAVLISAVGGISKDAATFLFAPHYYLHEVAANLSVQATLRYLEDLRVAMNDELTFGTLIGLNNLKAVAFVLDSTASMDTSLDAIKKYVMQLATQSSQGTFFYITVFNDREVRETRRFANPQDLAAYLGSVVAENGSDADENVYEALLATVRVVPPGAVVHVFTDATAKDPALQATIERLSNEKRLQVNFAMTGIRRRTATYRSTAGGGGKRRRREVSEREACVRRYRRLTRGTGGLLLAPEDTNLQTSMEKLGQLGSTAGWGTVILLDPLDVGCGDRLTNLSIPIDDTTSSIEISFVAEPGASVSDLVSIFTDFAGDRLHPKEESLLLATPEYRFYRFRTDRQAAVWRLLLGKVQCPGGGPFALRIRAESFLTANVMFTVNGTRILGQLRPGTLYAVFVDCADCGAIETIDVIPCGQTPPSTPLPVRKTEKRNWWFVEEVSVQNTDPVCVVFSGRTRAGFNFTRVHSEQFVPSRFTVSGRLTSRESPADNRVLPGTNATLHFRIENHGTLEDQVRVAVRGPRGKRVALQGQILRLAPRQVYEGVAEVAVEGEPGTLDAVELAVTSVAVPSEGASAEFDMVVVSPSPDWHAPSCRITHSTHPDCDGVGSRFVPCHAHNYTVEIEVSDVGSGIAEIRQGPGAWKITALADGHEFRAVGELSCCENVDVVVRDTAGFLAHCQLAVSSATARSDGVGLWFLFCFLLFQFLLL